MKRIYLSLHFILMTFILHAQTTTFEWVKSMGGYYGLATGVDVAVDNSNNVYTTGTFEGIVDFDPGVAIFNLSTSGYGDRDIFICKYDSSGNLLWAKQITGSSHYDHVSSIEADGSGNVYIAGYFEDTADFDPGPGIYNLTSSEEITFILKLNTMGNMTWVKQLGSVSGHVWGYSMCLDWFGNVYTTGIFWGINDFDPGAGVYNLTASGSDVFISKLDSTGNFVWAKKLESGNYANPTSIAADIYGNVYTTGYFNTTIDFDPGPGTYNLTTSGGYDVFISALNSSGNFSWAKQFTGSGDQYASSIAVDFIGNVFITGYFKYTVDFDPGPSSFNLTSAGDLDIFVSQLDISGNFVWAKKIGGPLTESASSITLDGSGNILISGNFSDSCDFDPGTGTFYLPYLSGHTFVSKYNATGNLVWAKQFGITYIGYANSIAVNNSGNVYTTGYLNGTADFDPGAGVYNLTAIGNCSFTSQLTSSGNFVWANSAGKGAGIYSKSIATDASGNILTTGSFNGTVDFDPGPGVVNLNTAVPEKDIFIHKSDASGNFLWVKQLTGISDDNVNAMAVDSSGNTYITGYFSGPIDFDPGAGSFILTPPGNYGAIFISKYDASGNFVWAKQINSSSLLYSYAYAITIDNTGKILVTGYFYGTVDFNPGPAVYNLTTTNFSAFILKLDDSGNFLWAKQFAGGSNYGYSISTDAGGNILTTGSFLGVIDFDPGASTYNLSSGSEAVFISKLNSSGNFVWAKKIEVKLNGNSGSDYHFLITTDSYGNVYSSSCFKDTVDLDPGPGVYNLISPYDDIYILKLDAAGNFVWAKQFAGGNRVRSTSMTADIYGNVYTTGYFIYSPDFDPGPGTFSLGSSGSFTSFISKLDTSGSFVWAYKSSGIGWSEHVDRYSICLNKSGDIYTTGTFSGTCDFDPDSTGTFNITSIGYPDMYIHKMSQCPWANIIPSGPTAFCNGGSVLLNANTGAGLSYQWKKNGNNIPGATSASYTATTAGNYKVVVSGTCGSATSLTVTVTINPLPSATITTGGPTTFCSGNSVVLNAPTGANYSYQWKKNGVNISGAVNSNYTATASGTYKVTVTNTNTGCSKTSGTGTVVTVKALPASTITPPGTISFCQGQSALLTANSGGGYTWQWTRNNIPLSGATAQTYTVTAAGKYRVAVTNMNGCTGISLPDTVLVPCVGNDTIDDARFGRWMHGVSIFPNPNSGEFTIQFSDKPIDPVTIELTDVIGNVVNKFIMDSNTAEIKTQNLSDGIYYLKIRNNDKILVRKINILK